jgi:peptide/nickel transport system substrate-binding protein
MTLSNGPWPLPSARRFSHNREVARPLAFAIPAILAGALAACDTSVVDFFDPGPSPERRSGHHSTDETLIVGKAADALSLDPARITDNESVEVCEQIYEHLVRYGATSTDVEPSLAQSWSVSPDGRTWTFHLRDGVRFHDGTPFDADAVVFSFERQRDPNHPAHEVDFTYWEGQYNYIKRIEAIDRLTVRIEIERPFAPFLSSLAMFPVSIVSPTAVRAYGHDYGLHPVGTGPFRLASWQRGDRIVLERNEQYWDRKARLRRLVFRAIPDARQRLVALEGGTVDVAFALLSQELQYVQLHPDLRLYRAPSQNVAYMAMNTRHPPFDDVNVRRAVNHAVNKLPIVKLVYQGLAVPATGPLPPGMWSYRSDIPDYAYDPARARMLLAQAEASGRFVRGKKYAFYVPRTPRPYLPDPEQVARVIQRNLHEVGIETELVVQDIGPHLGDVQAGKHDLCILGWAGDNGDPDNFLYVLLDRDTAIPGMARNLAFYVNDELHGILRAAQETPDRAERTRYYRRAQEIIAADAPWVPLAHAELAVAAREEVEDLTIHPSAVLYYRDVWIER